MKMFDRIIYISGGILGMSIIKELSNRRQKDQEKQLVYARMISANTTCMAMAPRNVLELVNIVSPGGLCCCCYLLVGCVLVDFCFARK